MSDLSLHFARPEWLWGLAGLPLLVLIVVRGRRRRSGDWSSLGQWRFPPGEGVRAWTLAIGFLLLALARPRWGLEPGSEVPPGHEVVLAIDVSRSMAAEDAVPDRLGVAVESAAHLIETLGRSEGERVAVVAFAGRGVIRCPMTENLGAALDVLRGLRPGEVEPGGSDLGAALATSLDVLDVERPEPREGRAIVLISDGEDHDSPGWRDVLSRLSSLGVIVHTVAVGDPEEGHVIPVRVKGGGAATSPLTYRGETVRTRRRDDDLKAISEATGGAFVPLGLKSAGLGTLYAERIAPTARLRREQERAPERVDRFPILLGLALALALGASWPRLRRRPALMGLLVLFSTAAGPPGRSASDLVRSGLASYQRGALDAALTDFRHASELSPTNPIPRYDAAATLFQLGRYEEAREFYSQSREHSGPVLRAKIDYALGNVAVALGDYRKALEHYDECLKSDAKGQALDAVRRDAFVNRRFAESKLPPASTDPEPSPGPSRPRPEDASREDPRQGQPPGDSGTPPPAGSAPTEAQGEPPQGGAAPGAVGGANPNGTPESEAAERLASAVQGIRRARASQEPLETVRDSEQDRKDW